MGTGKSVEPRAEAERLQHTRTTSDHRTLFIDLKRRSPEVIQQEVFTSEAFVGWTQGKHALTLLFDSMDECWRRVTELGPLILAQLRPHMAAKGRPALCVCLCCRAAEWQEELERDLRQAFGETEPDSKVQIWQLAPLTEDNVRVAAVTLNLEPEAFLAQVTGIDVQALAAHPITLRMLLDLAKAGQALGRTRADLYASGCERLCQDTHQAARTVPRLTTTVNERLAFASYLRGARCGIHVTGYFMCKGWPGEDPRRTASLSGLPIAEAQAQLGAERDRLMTTSNKRVETVVIDARL
jgi:hypothetical protein